MTTKYFRTLRVEGWWDPNGHADIEWWIRNGKKITIKRERIPFSEFIDLQYLYEEVEIKPKQLFIDS